MELNCVSGRIVAQATSYRRGLGFVKIFVRMGFVVSQGVGHVEQFLFP